jgi:hypothetical protein
MSTQGESSENFYKKPDNFDANKSFSSSGFYFSPLWFFGTAPGTHKSIK